jgi:hypothetical protein
MSYIKNNTQQFILAKLTQKGRELLSKGNLNYSKWAIGDSEFNYNVTGQTTEFLTPKDRQPDLKYYNPNSSGNLMSLLASELQTQKIKLVNRRTITTSGTPLSIDWSSNINWDSELLQFNPSCIFNGDIIGWKKQNVYKQAIIGTTGTTDQHYDYIQSAKYLGQFNILDDDSVDFSDTAGLNPCLDYSESLIDNNHSMSIICFPYDKVFNYYGEELYIDDLNQLTLFLPNLDYHRSNEISGTTFLSEPTLKYLGTNQIPYYDLIEDLTKTIDDAAKTVGRIFPGLQLITFTNDEIVAGLEEASGRSYTLPELQITLLPTNKTTDVILSENEVLYVSYIINQGAFPCQNIVKTVNLGKTGKYIKVDLASEMKASVDSIVTGVTFLWQKTTDTTTLPTVDGWNKLDITSYYSSGVLENLYLKATDLVTDQFALIDFGIDLSSKIIGNISTIPSTITTSYSCDTYKSIFNFAISENEFNSTTNPTYQTAVSRGLDVNIKVSEIGIYTDTDELVVIGKLGYPIDLYPDAMVTIHMELDF